MVLAKIIVNRTSLKIEWKHKIPKGIIGGKVQIEYADDAWEGLTKTAVFQGCVTKDVVDISSEVTIPVEVVEHSGFMLFFGIYGVDAENEIAVPTIWVPLGMVQRAADPSGDTSTDPTLPVWAQLEQKYEKLLYLADNPPEPVSVSDWNAAETEPGHILNRTHWIEKVEADYTFDGDITGRETIMIDTGTYLVKMSDQILTADDLYGQTLTVFMKGEEPEEMTFELSADNVTDMNPNGIPAVMANEVLWCVQSDINVDGISMKAGVYFLCVIMDGVPFAYAQKTSCLDGTKEVVHKLDNKYLDMEWCASVKDGMEVMLPETEQQFNGNHSEQDFLFPIEGNKVYGVRWDGNYYQCTAAKIENGFFFVNYIGNGHLYSSELPETDEPFCISCVVLLGITLATRIFAVEASTSHVVGVERIGKVNNRIPYEFLPQVYIMPTDIGYNDIRMEELAEAQKIIQAGGKVYARHNNSTYQVLQASYDFIDDQYHSLSMIGSLKIMMWSKHRGWTYYSPYDFVLTTSNYHLNEGNVEQGKKFKFTVDETGSLKAEDVTDSL